MLFNFDVDFLANFALAIGPFAVLTGGPIVAIVMASVLMGEHE